MANKVLGIEIGQNLTRVVEIDYKVKNPKIYNMFRFCCNYTIEISYVKSFYC